MTILDFASNQTLARTRRGLTVIQLHDDLWRVTRSTGEVLGYLERFLDRGEFRYRAKRMVASRKSFLPVGDFWIMDDAVDCFRPGV